MEMREIKAIKKPISLVLVMAILISCFAINLGVESQGTFNSNAIFDELPSGWTMQGTMLQASGGNMMATTTTSISDGRVTVGIQMKDNAPVQVGFYVRAASRNPRPIDTGYTVYIHRANNINQIEVKAGGFGNLVGTYPFDFKTGEIYDIALDTKGNDISVLLNEEEVITFESSVSGEGEVGLFRSGGAVAYSGFNIGDVRIGNLFLDGAQLEEFDSTRREYTIPLTGDVQSAPVLTAEKINTTDTIEYVQAEGVPGTGTVTVTDETGVSSRYQVHFVRETALKSLDVNGAPLEGFDSKIFGYTMLLPEVGAMVPEVVAVASDESCSIDYAYPTTLPGLVEVKVTSKDGSTSTTYTIYCVEGSSENVVKHVETIKKSMGYESVENAVKDLTLTHPNDYDSKYIETLAEFDQRIHDLALEHSQVETLGGTIGSEMKEEFKSWSTEALMANPLLVGQKWVYEARPQFAADHHNTHTSMPSAKWEENTGVYRAGGALRVIDFSTGEVETIMEDKDGSYIDPDVHWDGSKMLYSYRSEYADSYHIYEYDFNTGESKQLTNMEFADDMYPLYLPNDQIAFGSTREPKYVMCNVHIQSNLYRMNADGSNIEQINKNTIYDRPSSIMQDGRILYDRWEYTDRDFGDAQGLWAMAPDGTNSVHVYGNYLSSPGGIIDAVEIPGTTKMLTIMVACHDRPWGALAVINTAEGDGEKASIEQTWPANAKDLVVEGEEGAVEAWDRILGVGAKYEDPYALNDKYFMVSKAIAGEKMGLVLLDVYGNEILLHQETGSWGTFSAAPINEQERPNVITDRRNYDYDFENQVGTGYYYLENVYEGTHMEGVAPGSAKTLRIVEAGEKRQYGRNGHWAGKGGQQPAMSWSDLLNKRIWGDVPIEPDGSAYFEAPADKFLYFQVLDEDGKMIQTMRSGTVIQQGETTGCIGCHEDRRQSPTEKDASGVSMAMKKEPVKLTGWAADLESDAKEIDYFNYVEDVQPVFDKNCLSCHDFGGSASDHIVLAGDTDIVFNASYNEIWRTGNINVAGAGPADHYNAYEKGSHASGLIQTLDSASHASVKANMPEADYHALVTWIDTNGTYYPDYTSPFRENATGRSPIPAREQLALNQLTGVTIAGGYDHTTNQMYHTYGNTASWNMRTNKGPMITFERPELSPILSMGNNLNANKNSAEYKQAIAIIEKGAETLEVRPDVNMEGYQIDGMDAFRQALYNYRQDINYEFREAIANGEKMYDPEIGPFGAMTYEEFRFEDWEDIIGPADDLHRRVWDDDSVEGDISKLGAASIPRVDPFKPYGIEISEEDSQPLPYIIDFVAGADVDRNDDMSFMIGE